MQAWLLCLQLKSLNEFQFSVWAWADDIFLTVGVNVVSGTQTPG